MKVSTPPTSGHKAQKTQKRPAQSRRQDKGAETLNSYHVPLLERTLSCLHPHLITASASSCVGRLILIWVRKLGRRGGRRCGYYLLEPETHSKTPSYSWLSTISPSALRPQDSRRSHIEVHGNQKPLLSSCAVHIGDRVSLFVDKKETASYPIPSR